MERSASAVFILLCALLGACADGTAPAGSTPVCADVDRCFVATLKGQFGVVKFDTTVAGSTAYSVTSAALPPGMRDSTQASATIDLYPMPALTSGTGRLQLVGDSMFKAGVYPVGQAGANVGFLLGHNGAFAGRHGTLTISSVRGDTVSGTFDVAGNFESGPSSDTTQTGTMSGRFVAIAVHH